MDEYVDEAGLADAKKKGELSFIQELDLAAVGMTKALEVFVDKWVGGLAIEFGGTILEYANKALAWGGLPNQFNADGSATVFGVKIPAGEDWGEAFSTAFVNWRKDTTKSWNDYISNNFKGDDPWKIGGTIDTFIVDMLVNFGIWLLEQMTKIVPDFLLPKSPHADEMANAPSDASSNKFLFTDSSYFTVTQNIPNPFKWSAQKDMFKIDKFNQTFNSEIYINDSISQIQKEFDNLLVETKNNLNDLVFIQGLIFISLTPLHKENFDRQLMLYLTGIQTLNQLI